MVSNRFFVRVFLFIIFVFDVVIRMCLACLLLVVLRDDVDDFRRDGEQTKLQ